MQAHSAIKKVKSEDFYLGMDAIKKHGVESWRDEFFSPFSVGDYNRMRDVLFTSLKKVLSSDIHRDSKDVMRVMYKVLSKYAHFTHKYLLDSYLETYGYNVISSAGDSYLEMIGRIPDPGKKRVVRNLILNLQSGLNIVRGHKKCLALGSDARLKKLYAKNKKLSLVYIELNKILNTGESVPDFFAADLRYITEVFFNACSEIMDYFQEKYDIVLNGREEVISRFDSDVADDLTAAMKIYHASKAKIRSLGFKSVMVSGLGNVFHRIVMMAMLRDGRKVIGINHGNPLGIYDDPAMFLTEFLTLDTYVVPTKGSKAFFEGLLRSFSDFPLPADIRVESADDDYFLKLWRKEKAGGKAARSKRIMFVEASLFPYFTLYHGALYHSTQLDLSLRIMEMLKRNGYHVTVKMRANRLKESDGGGIYKGFADECLGGVFEDKYEAADTFVFPHPFTTALGFALATNRKIIYFLYENEKFSQKELDSLNKRCIPVNCRFDDRNRIIFNEKELLAALEKEAPDIDTEFLKNKMFP